MRHQSCIRKREAARIACDIRTARCGRSSGRLGVHIQQGDLKVVAGICPKTPIATDIGESICGPEFRE